MSLPIPDPVTIDDLSLLATRTSGVIAELRKRMLLPDATKNPPHVPSDKVATTCSMTKNQLYYKVKTGAFEPDQISQRGGRLEFDLREAQAWAREARSDRMRPAGKRAVTIAVAFFKGGVTKTTTTMTLAQGLSLLGHRVLNIDLDPQGSLTTLHGLLPDSEIDDADTLGPLFHGDQADVRYAIRKTYWPGIDIIPAASAMFSAEFALPARQMRDREFAFWNVLNQALESVRDDYDVILIDTPPSLSYVTINAFFAADGVIVPMTASMLDLASSAQFWKLFAELATSISSRQRKTYDFVNVLLAKVNANDTATRAVRDWISTVYGGKVMPVEIPLTTVTGSAASEFSTVFDIARYEGDSRTYKRARDAYEALALAVEDSLQMVWAREGAR